MAIQFSSTGAGLSRTSGAFLSTTSDLTVMFWGMFVSSTPTTGERRLLCKIANPALTTSLFIGTDTGNNTPVLTTNLFTNTPLTAVTDLTDHTVNGHNWVANGSPVTTTGPMLGAPAPPSGHSALLILGTG